MSKSHFEKLKYPCAPCPLAIQRRRRFADPYGFLSTLAQNSTPREDGLFNFAHFLEKFASALSLQMNAKAFLESVTASVQSR